MPSPTGEEFDDVRRQAAVVAQQFRALADVLLSHGTITPEDRDHVLNPTGNFADQSQPPAAPYSGVPMEGN